MRTLLVIGLLLLQSKAYGQGREDIGRFYEKFVTGFTELDIPPLQLSYVANLKEIKSLEEIERQEQFFQDQKNSFDNLNKNDLSEHDLITLDIIAYEIKLNLERLSLEKRFSHANEPLKESGIYDENYGKDWYCYFLKRWVDISVAPDSLFQFGLEEISNVENEIQKIRKEWKLDEEEFYKEVNSSKFLIFNKDSVQLLYEDLNESVRDEARHYFPKMDSIVDVSIKRGTNDAIAHVPAYYSDNTFTYNFFGESYDAKTLGWLFLHEAIPGHHYERSMSELADRNAVQNLFMYYGFMEGWGAYVEQYGFELGAYKSLADEYGLLEWDLVRSVRVALDIGINYYGWSDEKALQFWNDHIHHKDDVAKREINRMKNWPAQVITYKYGKKVLDKLKGNITEPEELKVFHSKVLKYGDIPLTVMSKYLQPDN